MKNNKSAIDIVLYILLAVYTLICLFAPLGIFKINFGNIINTLVYDPLLSGEICKDLDFVIPLKIVFTIMAIIEAIILIRKTPKETLCIVLCFFRTVIPALYIIGDILLFSDFCSLSATPYLYIMVIVNVLTLYLYNVKKKARFIKVEE